MKIRMGLNAALLILTAHCLSAGAQSAGGARQPASDAVDLTARFMAEGNGDSLKQHLSVMRNGRRLDATVLVAPARARVGLSDFSGKYTLKLWAAPVFNVGDGMQMDLALVVSGARRPLFSRYLDAGRRAEDRAWIPIEVPLDLPRAGDVYLEVQVSGGPQGDLVADWLALGEVRLVRER